MRSFRIYPFWLQVRQAQTAQGEKMGVTANYWRPVIQSMEHVKRCTLFVLKLSVANLQCPPGQPGAPGLPGLKGEAGKAGLV
jgi:hypothetical protein